MIFEGDNKPILVSFIHTGVDASLKYRYKVRAKNFNGYGEFSDIATLSACTFPKDLHAPRLVDVTQTTIKISWDNPIDTGGCVIFGYRIFIDDGLNGAFTEVSPINVNDKPFLEEYQIDMTGKTTGLPYRIKMVVVNVIGEIESDTIGVILADQPAQSLVATATSDGYALDITL
jgi:hypothetical protein